MATTDVQAAVAKGLGGTALGTVGPLRAKPNKNKKRSFTADDPLEVVITQVGGQWTIQPANNLKATMLARLNAPESGGLSLGQVGDNEWQTRGHVAGKAHPPFILDPPPHHHPIVMLEGESVRITCDQPFDFTIDVVKDSDVNPDPSFPGPARPFAGWTGPVNVPAGGSVLAAVLTPILDSTDTPIQDGPRDQRFYKFQAVVMTFGGPVNVDPDGFCDR